MCGMLNAVGINFDIISRENRARRGMAIINRRCFLLELGKALITPWAVGTTTAVIAFSTTPTEELDHSCACLFY